MSESLGDLTARERCRSSLVAFCEFVPARRMRGSGEEGAVREDSFALVCIAPAVQLVVLGGRTEGSAGRNAQSFVNVQGVITMYSSLERPGLARARSACAQGCVTSAEVLMSRAQVSKVHGIDRGGLVAEGADEVSVLRALGEPRIHRLDVDSDIVLRTRSTQTHSRAQEAGGGAREALV